MKIGIIVFSNTGNTLSAAERLEKKLSGKGHAATLVRLMPKAGYRAGQAPTGFEELPALDRFEALVFAAPVNAFSLCLPMKEYLETIEPLRGRKTALLTTEFFPYGWMGGTRAIAMMRRACEGKGGVVCGSAIVNWSRKDRERRIEAAVDEIAGGLIG
ncbi:MAG: flavodoxin family protein [Spirochaetales bacterium]|nr:flavodoxin family protein [Spirochaetales bacterium]